MAVGEEADPRRADHDHGDGGEPGTGERLAEYGRAAVEGPPCREQGRQHQGQEDRRLDVQAAQQGEDDAQGEQPSGQVVGDLEPAAQPPGEDDQTDADQAAEEVGELEDGERHEVRQPAQARRRGRDRAEHEHHRAAQEGEHRKQVRLHCRQPTAHDLGRLAQLLPSLMQLETEQEQHRHRQRQDVVDEPEREQGTEGDALRHGGRQEDHHHRLEHAEPARDLADETSELGEEEHGHEMGEVAGGLAGQEHVEDKRGRDPVETRQPDLGQGQAQRGQCGLPAAEPEGCAAHGAGQQVGGGDEQEDCAHWPQGRDREVQPGRDDSPGEGERDPRAGDQTQPEGDAVEGEDGRDLDRRQAPDRVEAEAHRRAAEDRRSRRSGRRRSRCSGKRRAPEPDSSTDIAQRQSVVLGQDQVAHRRGRNCRQEVPDGDPPEVVEHLVQLDQLELAMENIERDPEQHDPDHRGQTMQPASGGGVPCHVRAPV